MLFKKESAASFVARILRSTGIAEMLGIPGALWNPIAMSCRNKSTSRAEALPTHHTPQLAELRCHAAQRWPNVGRALPGPAPTGASHPGQTWRPGLGSGTTKSSRLAVKAAAIHHPRPRRQHQLEDTSGELMPMAQTSLIGSLCKRCGRS